MECPECGAELIYDGPYGYLAAHQSGEVLGHIYYCPNRDGFDDREEAAQYYKLSNGCDLDTSIDDLFDVVDVDEITCASSTHNGFYHTDKSGDLKEGYPC